ncbi:patatin [Variovorax sp. WS11]|uniref:patatin-like phospholipase family protein n=1 Tax=Variovorax sp. WS11 TaxID=1105204 RepID=UPI000D0D27CD|nr:patatin-like phospholipase family protein [Variovorax sp. WS11]NDZ15611.1 patatin-like phospholipase family protein [Variovorax sp. WS11]PSL83369.1 patatin [Variovorax sp. WS11]
MANTRRQRTNAPPGPAAKRTLPGQVVLVFQGGGALGAYQVGVYQALHEAGIEPDWVIGTSIGAINAALIAGNPPERRLDRLDRFWTQIQALTAGPELPAWPELGRLLSNMATLVRGIPDFFTPNLHALRGPAAPLGIEAASYYSTAPLRETLNELLDLDYLNLCRMRMTVGAVNARSGEMRYFDTRDEQLGIEHVMASGALPPAFPAVRIGGQPYWDGGIYSNTPIEAVLDDKPRRDSLIFAVNMWQQAAPEPQSILEVMARQKDIQYASRADSHIARQKQIHRLRHVIRELQKKIPAARRADPEVVELAAYGCGTLMHVAHLVATPLGGEDQTKDIDFTAATVRARRAAGLADARRMIAQAPWETAAVDPIEGVIEHR